MNTQAVTRPLKIRQIETMQVDVTLGGVTRPVKIARSILNGEPGCWYAELAAVTCRFRTGNKLHTRLSPQVYENNGRFSISRVVIANKEARAVAWADKAPANSEWKREARAALKSTAP